MQNNKDIQVNLARYKLFKEKPSIPLYAQVEEAVAEGLFWQTMKKAPETPFKPITILKRSPSIKP